MKTRIRIAIYALLLSPVVGSFSGLIPIWIDSSTRETVGVTIYKGFPIPFYQSAEGISIMGGWMPIDFILNLATWAVLLPASSLYIFERLKKRI
jgi:hypothetical protein